MTEYLLEPRTVFYVYGRALGDAIQEAYQMTDYIIEDHFMRSNDYHDTALYSFRAEVWDDHKLDHWLGFWGGHVEHFVENHRGMTISDALSLMATFGLIPAGLYIVNFELE